jgi:hypothetical protein
MNRPKKTCTAMVLSAAVLSQSFAFDTYGTSAADSSVSKSAPAASMFTHGSRVDPFSSWHVSIRGRGC